MVQEEHAEPREMSGMTSRLILAYVGREGGPQAVAELLRRTGLTEREEELRDENRWFSWDIKIALFATAGDVLGQDRIGARVGAAGLDLDIGAGLKRVLRALGTPALVYRNIVRACSKFSWTHRMTSLEVSDGLARIRYEDVSGVGYHQHDCDYNVGLLGAVTQLFGLPPARIVHRECALRGAASCVYEIRWAATRRLAGWAPAGAASGAAAAGVAALAGVDAALPVATALAAGGAGLAARAALIRTRTIEALARRVDERDEAADRLAASMRDLGAELRPDEVLGKIADHARSAVSGKEFALLLDRDGMRCVRSSGVPQASLAALEAWAAEPATFDAGTVTVDHLAADPVLEPVAADPDLPLGSLCAAPLRFHGRLLGVLVGLAHGPQGFLPHDAELLSSYAAQAAVTLSNAQMVERLERMAHEDALTGLANQRHFHRRLAAEGNRSQRAESPLSVIMLDLDHFKRINDTHGHPRGDEVLRAVADALRSCLRPYDTVARMGGEEFAVILPDTEANDAYELAERVRATIARVQVEGITLSCSAGVVAWPADTSELDGMLRCADEALYEAKRAGRARTRRYKRGSVPAEEQEAATARVRGLLDDPDGLHIVFQPIMALSTGQLAGFEALARFPGLPDLRPDAVFRLAHEAGLGPELEALAIERALAEPGRPAGTGLCVNASLSALTSPNLWAVLPGDLSGVVVELTEHELYESESQLQDTLARLRDRGARVAVDDVGAGYAGLQQLARVKPEVVKLDRSLVDGVAADPGRAALIEAFVRFAAGTGAVVCAEGVETVEDLKVVASLDVGYAQGWAIARPGDAWASVAADASAAVAETADGGLRPISGLVGLGDQVHEVCRLVAAGDAEGARALVAAACRADHLVVQAVGEVDGPARRRVLETGLPGQVLAHDPLADPGEVARLAELGCRSLLLVPIVDEGRAVGVLEAARRSETAWTRIDAEQAELLARRLEPLLELPARTSS